MLVGFRNLFPRDYTATDKHLPSENLLASSSPFPHTHPNPNPYRFYSKNNSSHAQYTRLVLISFL